MVRDRWRNTSQRTSRKLLIRRHARRHPHTNSFFPRGCAPQNDQWPWCATGGEMPRNARVANCLYEDTPSRSHRDRQDSSATTMQGTAASRTEQGNDGRRYQSHKHNPRSSTMADQCVSQASRAGTDLDTVTETPALPQLNTTKFVDATPSDDTLKPHASYYTCDTIYMPSSSTPYRMRSKSESVTINVHENHVMSQIHATAP